MSLKIAIDLNAQFFARLDGVVDVTSLFSKQVRSSRQFVLKASKMTENADYVQDPVKKRNYKWCFVPLCKSTTISTPLKIFVSVPKGDIRKKWFEVARRNDASSISLSTSLFCCQDHFHLQEDIENYTRVRLDPNASVRLKKGALPRIFNCQPDRQRAHVKPTRPVALKRQKIETLNEILQTETVISSMECESTEPITIESLHIDTNIGNSNDFSTTQHQVAAVEIDWSNDATPKCKDVGIQVKMRDHKTMRSKYVQNVPVMQDASCSTKKLVSQQKTENVIASSESTSANTNVTSTLNDTLDDCDDEYLPSEETSEEAVKQNILEQRRRFLWEDIRCCDRRTQPVFK
ncbi:uncharacterized protein [Temnothorax longispinosus]|uniref:uncharacterized protein isoform X2 n=1 Tax=Temnothorax longispinosus TaxID=300112 RepID=UPI003A992882